MWIRGYKILWIKLYMEGDRHFHISIPVSMLIAYELTDCVMDLLTLICWFVPKRNKLHSIKELVKSVIKLIDSLTEGEPYELVDVEADKVSVSILVR